MKTTLPRTSWIYNSEIKALRRTSFYNSWHGMIQRCDDPKSTNYHRWGGRGISYPAKWRTFDGFHADMFASYKPGLSLDRIDNDKDYSAENCRWSTRKEQNNNQSTNRKLTIDGVTKNLAQWIDASNVKPSTVRQRFYAYHWPIEEALGFKPNSKARI